LREFGHAHSAYNGARFEEFEEAVILEVVVRAGGTTGAGTLFIG
jgi:hypothetical protein